MIFPTAYFPPISYISRCIAAGNIIVEQHEHFIKQTYRNRCHIYNSNGMLPLVMPVEHNDLFKKPIKDVRISFGQEWKKNHWRSICSAYKNAPFFEFIEDELSTAFHTPSKYLLEFNTLLLKSICAIAKLNLTIGFTESYSENIFPENDLRHSFHPKRPSPFSGPVYHQVFEDKHGFIPDLSCLDLLVNEGSLRP